MRAITGVEQDGDVANAEDDDILISTGWMCAVERRAGGTRNGVLRLERRHSFSTNVTCMFT